MFAVWHCFRPVVDTTRNAFPVNARGRAYMAALLALLEATSAVESVLPMPRALYGTGTAAKL